MSHHMNIQKLSRELHVPVNRDDVYFRIMFSVSNLSVGSRKQGAVLVNDKNGIIGAGAYEGFIDPAIKDDQKEIGLGAIEFLISDCSRMGTSTENSKIYVNTLPNVSQCKMIARAGIKEIHCLRDIINSDAHKVCAENNIKVFIHVIQPQ